MGIIADKLQRVVDNTNISKYGDTIAEITSYDKIKNTASIRFTNPNGGALLTANNITVKISNGGLSQASPAIGQKCLISFLNNNLLAPVITSFSEDEYFTKVYSKKNNADQGAYIVDDYINDVDININISPMINDYINTSQSSQYCYISKDYTNVDAAVETRKSLMEIDKYKDSEDGITNINTKSTVKFKDNGDIDIFVNNNTGIRINPNTKNISFFGKTMNTTLTDKWTINTPEVIINGNLEVTGEFKQRGKA